MIRNSSFSKDRILPCFIISASLVWQAQTAFILTSTKLFSALGMWLWVRQHQLWWSLTKLNVSTSNNSAFTSLVKTLLLFCVSQSGSLLLWKVWRRSLGFFKKLVALKWDTVQDTPVTCSLPAHSLLVFLLFDLHFEYLDKFFYVMIVVPSFALRLHTSKSSNPHIPDDCDTHVHLKEYFQKSIKGRRRVKHAHLYFTPPKSTHFQKESMLWVFLL